MPGTMLEWVPNMPARLRELRIEFGWTLETVATVVGVTQRGVVSNWEATNQRHRVPDITNLLILQKWYGVSLDYLLGHPGADRDSPAVKAGKKAVRERLRAAVGVGGADPSDRARLAVTMALEVAPEAFFLGRLAAALTIRTESLTAMLEGAVWPDLVIERLAPLLGVKSEWFYAPEPAEVLDQAQ